MVSPAFVPFSPQLSSVNDVFNGVLVKGAATVDVMFYGKGAGKMPTASAVVADVIHIAKSNGTSDSVTWEDSDGNNVSDIGTYERMFYYRLQGVTDQKQIERIWGGVKFIKRENQPENELAFITQPVGEANARKMEQSLDEQVKILGKIRVLH